LYFSVVDLTCETRIGFKEFCIQQTFRIFLSTAQSSIIPHPHLFVGVAPKYAPSHVLPLPQKFFRCDASLIQDGAQSTFWHISRMIGYGGVLIGLWVAPNFMGASRLPVELETKLFEPSYNLSVSKT